MPLSLTDPRWSELQSSYGDTEDIVAWLADAHSSGLSDERIGDLINEVLHQGGTSTAMYAVSTHLILLASRATPERALTLLSHAGMSYERFLAGLDLFEGQFHHVLLDQPFPPEISDERDL
jgi:hypothetical protein